MSSNSVALDDALDADMRRQFLQVEATAPSLVSALDRIHEANKRQDQEESITYAINETLAWLNGPGGSVPEMEEIVRFGVNAYRAHQAMPVVQR